MNAQPPDNPVLHPYVAYIKHRLEALLRYVDLESDGEVVQPTAIRLRRPERWARALALAPRRPGTALRLLQRAL